MHTGILSNNEYMWWKSLLEEGGTALTFEGTRKSCNLKVTLRVHTPKFYWKVILDY